MNLAILIFSPSLAIACCKRSLIVCEEFFRDDWSNKNHSFNFSLLPLSASVIPNSSLSLFNSSSLRSSRLTYRRLSQAATWRAISFAKAFNSSVWATKRYSALHSWTSESDFAYLRALRWRKNRDLRSHHGPQTHHHQLRHSKYKWARFSYRENQRWSSTRGPER